MSETNKCRRRIQHVPRHQRVQCVANLCPWWADFSNSDTGYDRLEDSVVSDRNATITIFFSHLLYLAHTTIGR